MSSELSPDDFGVLERSLPDGFEFVRCGREARGKGISAEILQERGIFIPGMTEDGGKDRNKSVSMAYVLGEQPDFKAVEPSLKIRVERLGGHCLIPKVPL
ncbi:unnamed protein product [Discosporangium mesarthrocarpum]